VADNKIFTNLFNGIVEYPITLPFGITAGNKKFIFSGTTLSNNKINQFQSIIKAEVTPNAINFKVYNLNGNTLNLAYTKSANFILQPFYSFGVYLLNAEQATNILEGDFNVMVLVI